MKVTKFTVNPFGENTFIAWDENTRQAIIIDPGMMQDHEREVVVKFVEDNQLKMQRVLLTHGHIDHIAAARWMADRYGITVAASPHDQLYYQIELGDEKIHVFETPGHSQGGLIFYAPDSALAFTGDTIFEGSIGRTDLSGGDYNVLIASIRDKVLTLPSDTMLIPGHGPTTTVANERDYNPYLA